MATDPQSIVHRWFDEVWNQGREETIDELFGADAVGHGLSEGEEDVRGPAGFKVFLRNMRSAFPDVRITIEDTIVEGDKVAARVKFRGTHLGDSLGFPATGRCVSISGIVIARVAGGQVVEGWNSWDQLGLLRQIGALPGAQTPDRFVSCPA